MLVLPLTVTPYNPILTSVVGFLHSFFLPHLPNYNNNAGDDMLFLFILMIGCGGRFWGGRNSYVASVASYGIYEPGDR